VLKTMANRPIEFIKHSGGKFHVTREAVSTFSKYSGRIAIIVVAGPYRTGKSYLLNRLIGRAHGFSVGGTINACTKGIWLWGSPITRNGVTYFFMDSEGLGSLDQEGGFDATILTLAVLLSSLFVLNTQGTISESSLELLELVTECSSRIRVSHDSKKPHGAELGQHFPSFLWVLRDFALALEDENGDPISSKEYLEKALMSQKGSSERVKRKNKIRKTLRDVFPVRDCATLVRPVMDERNLRNMAKLPESQLRPQFRRGLEKIKELVMEAPVKTISGTPLNGSAFIQLARAYTDAINKGGMPTIKTAWQSVVEIQARDAIDHCVSVYKSKMKIDMDVADEEKLFERHRSLEERARQYVLEQVAGDLKLKEHLLNKLQASLDELFEERRSSNRMKSRQQASSTIESLWEASRLDDKEFKSAQEWYAERARIIKTYSDRVRGPAKGAVLQAFLEKKAGNALQKQMVLNKKLSTQTRKLESRISSLQERVRQLVQEKQAMKLEAQTEIDKKGYTIAQQSERLDKAAAELKQLHKKIGDASRFERELRLKSEKLSDMSELVDSLKEELRQKKKELGTSLRQKNAELSDKATRLVDMRKKIAAGNKELSMLRSKEASWQHQLDEMSIEVKELRRMVGAKENAVKDNDRLAKGFKREIQQLRTQLRDQAIEMKDKDLSISRLEAQMDELKTNESKHDRPESSTSPVFDEPPAGFEEEMPVESGYVYEKPPEKMTIQKLKSRLTELDVELPATQQKKKFYVDLLYEKDPGLKGSSRAPRKKKQRSR